MARYDKVDLRVSSDGDLMLTKGDLSLVSADDFLQQQIRNRVSNNNPEWFYDPICADLEDLIGMPNTRETAGLGTDKIVRALTYDDMFSTEDIYIRPVPTGRHDILYFVFINSPYSAKPISFEVALNLSSGATVRRV